MLLTSTPIIGFSFIDNKLWQLIIAGIGAFAYACVRALYKFGIVDSRSEGSNADLIIFIIPLLLVFFGIQWVMNWINSWSLVAKIIVPSVLGAGIIGIIVYGIYDYIEHGDNYCN